MGCVCCWGSRHLPGVLVSPAGGVGRAACVLCQVNDGEAAPWCWVCARVLAGQIDDLLSEGQQEQAGEGSCVCTTGRQDTALLRISMCPGGVRDCLLSGGGSARRRGGGRRQRRRRGGGERLPSESELLTRRTLSAIFAADGSSAPPPSSLPPPSPSRPGGGSGSARAGSGRA